MLMLPSRCFYSRAVLRQHVVSYGRDGSDMWTSIFFFFIFFVLLFILLDITVEEMSHV